MQRMAVSAVLAYGLIAILEPNLINPPHAYILGKCGILISAVGYVISFVPYFALYGKKVLFKIE